MGLFNRKPFATGQFRVTGVTPVDGSGRLVLQGVPQQKLHVTGLLETDGAPPQAAAFDMHAGIGLEPKVGDVRPAEILKRDPLKLRVDWQPSRLDSQVEALREDASAQVVADLATTGRENHRAGDMDPLGIAITDPHAADTIAANLAATLGTPISMDVNTGGSVRHLTAGNGSHLSTADAAELLRSGTSATAVIRSAARVNVPQAMMPGPDASLWDLTLEVHRADGTTYEASTRVGFRTEARRAVIGAVGLEVPVRRDPNDDSRVALDSIRFDAEHPDAPRG